MSVHAASAAEPARAGHRYRSVATALLLIAWLVHALWAGTAKVTSDDLWWDMTAGRYFFEHRALAETDVFSYPHFGVPWQNGEWLAHVIFFAFYHYAVASASLPSSSPPSSPSSR
jgi:hypothetical protein